MKKNIQKYITARKLRGIGWSFKEIGDHLKVQKSTLHGWLKNIKLSQRQKLRLRKNWENGLKKARTRAVESHHQKTREKFKIATIKAEKTITDLKKSFNKKSFLRLILSTLYLGEGTKNKSMVCLANSNPDICKFFIALLRNTYKIDETKFRCHLHLRTDQNINKKIIYWSQLLQIPQKKFHKTQIDKRSSGKTTYPDYHGVCAIYYYDAKVQKEILTLGNELINKILCERAQPSYSVPM